VSQFQHWPVLIPEGFKLIAVGERCATPTELSTKCLSDPERVKDVARSVTPSGSNHTLIEFRGRRATLAHGY